MTFRVQADPEIALDHGLGAIPTTPSDEHSTAPNAESESKHPPATVTTTATTVASAAATEEEMVPSGISQQQRGCTSNNLQNNNINQEREMRIWKVYATVAVSLATCLIPTMTVGIALFTTDSSHPAPVPVPTPAPIYFRRTRMPISVDGLPSRRPRHRPTPSPVPTPTSLWRPTWPVRSPRPTPTLPDSNFMPISFPVRPRPPFWSIPPDTDDTVVELVNPFSPDIIENPFSPDSRPTATPVSTPSFGTIVSFDRPSWYPTEAGTNSPSIQE